MDKTVNAIISKYHEDKTRLMDILIDTQDAFGFITEDAADTISEKLDISSVDLEQTISFYHFFSTTSRGKYTIYLNNSAVANMHGRRKVAKAFEKETGIKFGEVTEDGLIGLFDTSCIGMNDQEPAAIINGAVFTRLTPFRVKEIIKDIQEGVKVEDMFRASYGDGNNSLALIRSVVNNHIMKKGPVLSSDYTSGQAIKKIISMAPEEVIEEVKISNIRGRGGAGFPTGLKWDFCRKSAGEKRYVFCNADEGEPGTFKDRVIMTERPRLLFEGMAVAAYAIGAEEGILYLRYEYKYLQKFLESILEEMRHHQLLGKNIGFRAVCPRPQRLAFMMWLHLSMSMMSCITPCPFMIFNSLSFIKTGNVRHGVQEPQDSSMKNSVKLSTMSLSISLLLLMMINDPPVARSS